MKFKNITKEAVCELLLYLAEHEEFESLKSLKAFTKEEMQEVLREIAIQLKEELTDEGGSQRPHYQEYNLSPKALSLISCLSPREELLLFKSFKLL